MRRKPARKAARKVPELPGAQRNLIRKDPILEHKFGQVYATRARRQGRKRLSAAERTGVVKEIIEWGKRKGLIG